MEFTKLTIITAILGLIALVLEITGFSIRGWVRFKVTMFGKKTYYQFGLWSVEVCDGKDGACTTVKHSGWQDNNAIGNIGSFATKLNISVYHVPTCLAVVLAIMASMFLALYLTRSILINRCWGMVSLSLLISTGGLFWYVVVKFAKIATNLHPILGITTELTAMSPYSVILTALGATISFVVAGLVFLQIFRTSCMSEGTILVRRNPQTGHALLAVKSPVTSTTTVTNVNTHIVHQM